MEGSIMGQVLHGCATTTHAIRATIQRSQATTAALVKRGIAPCIPPRAKRKNPATYCKALYKKRHKVENMFAKLKDWLRIAMRYDRCAHVFLSAIQIAAVVIFWINQ